jgi:uncharacterized Fe-S center protein
MDQLFFADARVRVWNHRSSLPGKFERLLRRVQLENVVKKGEPVAVKMHFGSWGAFKIIRPAFVRKVVDSVREAGGKPFVCDTVRIKGIDYLEVAAQNGITPQSVNAPVILADGLNGLDYVKVECSQKMPFAPVASCIHDAPSMIVLSHCKGHVQAGYAGAVKNLAMGGVSAQNREDAQVRKKVGRAGMHLLHRGDIEYDASLCDVCGQCIDACPLEALSIKDDELVLDRKKCWSCCRCARVCPTGAMKAPEVGEDFQDGMAEVAKAVLSTFDEGRVYYFNFLLDIQPECDCMPGADVNVVQDIGILGGPNPCSVDIATCDLIARGEPLRGSMLWEAGVTEPGTEPWEKLHGKTGRRHVEILAELADLQTEYRITDIEGE